MQMIWNGLVKTEYMFLTYLNKGDRALMELFCYQENT